MNWQKWVILGWLLLVALLAIANVGKIRQTSGGHAVVALVECALIAWLVVIA